jgi:hypothetical protein
LLIFFVEGGASGALVFFFVESEVTSGGGANSLVEAGGERAGGIDAATVERDRAAQCEADDGRDGAVALGVGLVGGRVGGRVGVNGRAGSGAGVSVAQSERASIHGGDATARFSPRRSWRSARPAGRTVARYQRGGQAGGVQEPSCPYQSIAFPHFSEIKESKERSKEMAKMPVGDERFLDDTQRRSRIRAIWAGRRVPESGGISIANLAKNAVVAFERQLRQR